MKTYHPLVIFLFFVAAIALTMCALHPVLSVMAVAAAAAWAICLKGCHAFLGMLGFYLGVVVVMTVFNALFNTVGLTVLFYVGSMPVTAEALVFGLSSGALLVAVLTWFSCYQEVMGADKFLALFGRVLPTTSMMITLVFGFIPGVLERGRSIANARKALVGEEKSLKAGVRLASVLMGWSMETGLITAASMKARAYGSTQRSTYLNMRWTLRDTVALVLLLALTAAAVAAAVVTLSGFRFYPYLTPLHADWLYAPYALLLVLPLLLEGGERLRWRLSSL
ncbi:MAG: energy-coupling factor transporter transmembrane protein EcfT [Coriobacteriales bacterium]|nr:energy-coupling factor transporter transmembrane protein EcfT [Coriobacteriales bacterium]